MFRIPLLLALCAGLPLTSASAAPNATPDAVQLPDFTYQGRLERDGQLLDGNVDLRFSLWDAASGGTQVGSTIVENAYPVSGGLFTITLAFPGAFAGEQRWLEVSVDGTAMPRQPIATAPVAQYALNGNAGPKGDPGTTGQDAVTVHGTGQLPIVETTTSYTLVPGLRQTITVPANAKVAISTDGGAQNTGTGSTHAIVDIGLFVDGVAAGERRLVLANTSSLGQIIGNWNLSLSRALSAGSHTIEVRAKDAGGTADANVSGTTPLLRGQLTVLVLKQ